MKILLIAEPFFGYEDRIKEHLLSIGHDVDVKFLFTPNFKDRIKKQLLRKEFDQDYYYKNLLDKNKTYDILLMLNGKNIPLYFIKELSSKFKAAKKILYIWDDIKNLNQSDEFFNLFDVKYTYSRFDADESRSIQFMPFFYSHDIQNIDRSIDVSFVGSLHSDRYKKLKKIKESNSNLTFQYYLYADLITYLKYCSNVKLKDVRFTKLSYEDYITYLANSKAVLELPHPSQQNITTRAIEAIGTRTKLITTSSAVKNYDFYNPNNIFILTTDNSFELEEWLKKEYENNSEEIRKKYAIDSWIYKILQ